VSSALKMEAMYSIKMLLNAFNIAERINLENQHLKLPCA